MAAISNLYARGNDVLNVNPPPPFIDIHITAHGSDWLWAVFSVFSILTILHGSLYGFTSKSSGFKKFLFLYPLVISAINTIAYFTYASNLGYTSTPTEFNHVTTSFNLETRQIFYVKFISWFLSWPFVLSIFEFATHTLDYNSADESLVNKLISLFQGLLMKVLATEVFVLGLLIGALIHSSYKWGYFTFAVAAQLFAMSLVFFNIWGSFRIRSGNRMAHFLIMFQLLVWLLYPIAWGLSEGGNVIQPDSEAVFYGILDLITFGVMPAVLTWINVTTIDSGFFGNFVKERRHSHFGTEKSVGETPRHSGDTAVAGTTHMGEPMRADEPMRMDEPMRVNEPMRVDDPVVVPDERTTMAV